MLSLTKQIMSTLFNRTSNQTAKSPFYIYDLPDTYFIRKKSKMTIVPAIAVGAIITCMMLLIMGISMS